MKKITTVTIFQPLRVNEDGKFKEIFNAKGVRVEFKTRKQVENYCSKNKTIYVENKMIFYR